MFKVLAIFTLSGLLASTVGVSTFKGYIVGGPKFAVLNGGFYTPIALLDILFGAMAIDLILTLILGLVYNLVDLWRWLLNLLKKKKGEVRISIPVRVKRPKVVSPWYRMAMYMAMGLVYLLEPLMGKEISEAQT